jgi:hypothetical protein
MVSLEVFNPCGAMEVIQAFAPRVDRLAGKTIGVLSVDMWQSHRTLPEIRKVLGARFPSATIIPETEFPQGVNGIDSDQAANLVIERGCDAVIIGSAA